MKNQIIDCCSLINLHTGWGSLTQLQSLDFSLHIAEAVLDESVFVNEFDSNGEKVKSSLDLRSMQLNLGYTVVRPQTPDELSDYVEFAMEIDDGEAQSLAIAKHRGLILLTDDRKALNVANRSDVKVKTYTTPQVLQMWSAASEPNAQQLPEILRRISELARYRPRANSPERLWWDSNLAQP
jgi:predicted nucleic acid-binding protein